MAQGLALGVNYRFGHEEVHQERLLTGNEFGNPKADSRERLQRVLTSRRVMAIGGRLPRRPRLF